MVSRCRYCRPRSAIGFSVPTDAQSGPVAECEERALGTTADFFLAKVARPERLGILVQFRVAVNGLQAQVHYVARAQLHLGGTGAQSAFFLTPPGELVNCWEESARLCNITIPEIPLRLCQRKQHQSYAII